MSTTMQAIRLHDFGGPEVMQLEAVARPVAGPGEVLVKVRAASVNPVDWKLRAGYLKAFLPYQPPLTPGLDLAGTVEAVGPDVTGFAVGDEVFGKADFMKPNGSYAQYVAVAQSALAPKPRTLDFIHAAAVPVVATSAWQALFGAGAIELKPGQTVLIHAGAGGVGSFAIQLAKWKGATVIATASAGNQALLLELGADQAIDYTAAPFETVVGQVDAVVDTIGGDTQARSWGLLKPGGVLASLMGAPAAASFEGLGVRGVGVSGGQANAQLGLIGELIDQGVLKTVVSKVLPLAQAAQAHVLSQSGHARGKIVLEVE